MAGKIVVSEILSDATSSNTIKIGTGMTLDLNAQGTTVLPAGSLVGTLPAISGASLTNLPAGGKVLQVVQTADTGQETSTSSGWNDLGSLSLSITPASTTSKIWIICHLGTIHQTVNTHIVYFRFLRDSTAVGVGSVGSRTGCTASTRGQGTGDGNAGFNMSFNYLDSPSTTSAITYKVQYNNWNSGEFHYNRDDAWSNNGSYPTPISTITVMEIA